MQWEARIAEIIYSSLLTPNKPEILQWKISRLIESEEKGEFSPASFNWKYSVRIKWLFQATHIRRGTIYWYARALLSKIWIVKMTFYGPKPVNTIIVDDNSTEFLLFWSELSELSLTIGLEWWTTYMLLMHDPLCIILPYKHILLWHRS